MNEHTYSFAITIAGTPTPADVEDLLVSAVVDDSINVPDMFVLTFRDPDRKVLAKTGVVIGAKVVIKVVSAAASAGEHLMTGEVTALEAEYTDAGTTTVIRGLDHSHRLFRGRQNRTYQNVTASDIVRTVAQRAGLAIGTITPTTSVMTHVSQADESDWEFLRRLGRQAGRILAVVEGKVDFRSPSPVSSAPRPGSLGSRDPFQLTVGENIRSIRAVVTSAEQVSTVEVRGYDAIKERAVVATANAATTSASLGIVTPASLARVFGGPKLVASRTPYKDQALAQAAADAAADELGGSFAELIGRADGSPRLAAGAAVSLGLMDAPFDGRYVLTSSRHEWVPARGYHTDFVASGRQERTLLGLTAGGGGEAARVPGMLLGVVTNANDPEKLGRIRVKLPSLGVDFETDWCQVIYPGAGGPGGGPGGAAYGLFLIPEVGDHVVVAFELGDVGRPLVVGCLYTDRRKPPLTGAGHVDGTSGKVESRVLRGRSGNTLRFEDKEGATEEISLRSKDDKMLVQLLTKKRIVHIESDMDIEVKAGKDVKVTAAANVSVEANANVKVKATGNLELEGAMVSIKASGPMTLSGSPIKLN